MNSTAKKTLVLGASDNPNRYSYLAVQRLKKYHYPVVAIGKRKMTVSEVPVETEKIPFTGIDTVSIYLNPEHQKEYYQYILSLHPRRIIFNPGAENEELKRLAAENRILAIDACTLVLLNTRQY